MCKNDRALIYSRETTAPFSLGRCCHGRTSENKSARFHGAPQCQLPKDFEWPDSSCWVCVCGCWWSSASRQRWFRSVRVENKFDLLSSAVPISGSVLQYTIHGHVLFLIWALNINQYSTLYTTQGTGQQRIRFPTPKHWFQSRTVPYRLQITNPISSTLVQQVARLNLRPGLLEQTARPREWLCLTLEDKSRGRVGTPLRFSLQQPFWRRSRGGAHWHYCCPRLCHISVFKTIPEWLTLPTL